MCRERTLFGATALHLASVNMDALVPSDAADTVHTLSTAGGIHRRADTHCPPLQVASSTPLEAACASSQQAQSAIDALVLEGARLDGVDGARALLTCLACSRRRKARLLLQRQVLPIARCSTSFLAAVTRLAYSCSGTRAHAPSSSIHHCSCLLRCSESSHLQIHMQSLQTEACNTSPHPHRGRWIFSAVRVAITQIREHHNPPPHCTSMSRDSRFVAPRSESV